MKELFCANEKEKEASTVGKEMSKLGWGILHAWKWTSERKRKHMISSLLAGASYFCWPQNDRLGLRVGGNGEHGQKVHRRILGVGDSDRMGKEQRDGKGHVRSEKLSWETGCSPRMGQV